MKYIDNLLQDFRISQAKKYISKGSNVLDIGSADGIMFNQLKDIIKEGVGIDPTLSEIVKGENYTLLPGYFPNDLSEDKSFDAITMLAVLEHIPPQVHESFSNGCAKYLKKGGKLIITVPSPQVDYILNVLKFFKLIDGMSLEEHYGFNTQMTYQIFKEPNFKLVKHSTFQFGLNNLFVFEKN